MTDTAVIQSNEPFENPQTIELLPGPVLVDYKHVYAGVATPMRLPGGLEVILLAKNAAALEEVFSRFALGECDFNRVHEAIVGPKSKTVPAPRAEVAPPSGMALASQAARANADALVATIDRALRIYAQHPHNVNVRFFMDDIMGVVKDCIRERLEGPRKP